MQFHDDYHQCAGWANSSREGTCPVMTRNRLCYFCARTEEMLNDAT